MNTQESDNRRNQVERYINGEMHSDELQTFEQRMRDNVGLARDVVHHRDVLAGMDFYFKKDLKFQLQQEEARLRKKPVNYIKIIGIAASIIAVLGAGYYFFMLQQSKAQTSQRIDTTTLFSKYNSKFPNIVTQSQQAEDSVIATTGLGAYESGNYTEAAQVLEEKIATGANESYILFYAGLSYLNLNENQKAINYLEKVGQSADAQYAIPAQWYTGLGYLHQGDVEKAKQFFEKIAGTNSDFSRKASAILQAM